MHERENYYSEIFDTEPTEKTSPLLTTEKKKDNITFDPEKKEIIITPSEGREEKRHTFQEFLYALRDEGLPSSTSEWLDLQTLLKAGEVQDLDELYIVSRAVLVKDVAGFPKFDVVFGKMFYGLVPPKPEEEEDYSQDEEYPDNTDTQEHGKDELRDEDLIPSSEKTEKKTEKLEEKKEDKKPEEKEDKPKQEKNDVIQKEKENIQEVNEATSETSEQSHGGKEATKDIEGSPNPADEGKEKDNKGAKKGVEGKEGEGKEGEGGDNKSQKAETGEGGDKKSGKGSKGHGVHKGKSKIIEEHTGGVGSYVSAKERILERRFDELDEDRTLSYEQFTRALSKLKGIIQETTSAKTRTLDAKATVQSISEHGGAPELLWKEEVEHKPNVVMMFDVGGTTDDFRPLIEQLFAAAKDELQGLEVFYFHNIMLGNVWPQKDGNYGSNPVSISEIVKRDPSTKIILVGDAQMGYDEGYGGLHNTCDEIHPDWYNPADAFHNKTGIDNVRGIVKHFDNVVWLWIPANGSKQSRQAIIDEQYDFNDASTLEDISAEVPMFDLTLRGLESAVKKLMEDK